MPDVDVFSLWGARNDYWQVTVWSRQKGCDQGGRIKFFNIWAQVGLLEQRSPRRGAHFESLRVQQLLMQRLRNFLVA